MIDPAYGSRFFSVLHQDIRDRLRGDRLRVRARHGYLRAPAEQGRLVWIVSDGEPASVRMGAELLAALRRKRLDIRLVLTYEEEYPELLTSRFRGLAKIGFGFGVCDRPRAVRRALDRLEPLGVIFAGSLPGRHFLDELERRRIHSVSLQAPAVLPAPVQACYPLPGMDDEQCEHSYPPVDLATIYVEQQVDATLGGLLRQGGVERLFWLQGVAGQELGETLQAWQEWPLAHQSLLIVGAADSRQLSQALDKAGLSTERFSRWQRRPLPAGGVMLLDDPQWLPAVAASVDASYIAAAERGLIWQAMAGAHPLWFGAGVDLAFPEEIARLTAPASVFGHWQAMLDNPHLLRQQGDLSRRLFWSARRQAAEAVEHLLQRVFDW